MTDLPDKSKLLPQEVADYFRVSVRTVLRLCHAGDLRYCRIAGIRIYRDSVIEYEQRAAAKEGGEDICQD